MSTTKAPYSTTEESYKYSATPAGSNGGWLFRLGIWSATHLRVVLIAWLIVVAAFGAFAPQVESALSGGGWQDSGSQSIAARDLIAKDFAGLGSTALQVVVHDSKGSVASDPVAQHVIAQATARLKADDRISTVVAPQPGMSISRDGRTAIVQAGAAVDANEMIRAADDLIGPLRKLSTGSVTVQVTGSSALWANFNQVNHEPQLEQSLPWLYPGSKRFTRLPTECARVAELYQSGVTQVEIARRLGRHKSIIWHVLERAGLKGAGR